MWLENSSKSGGKRWRATCRNWGRIWVPGGAVPALPGKKWSTGRSLAGVLFSDLDSVPGVEVGGSMAGTTLEGGGALGFFLVLFAKARR